MQHLRGVCKLTNFNSEATLFFSFNTVRPLFIDFLFFITAHMSFHCCPISTDLTIITLNGDLHVHV